VIETRANSIPSFLEKEDNGRQCRLKVKQNKTKLDTASIYTHGPTLAEYPQAATEEAGRKESHYWACLYFSKLEEKT
jgi:hypothetical protein